MKNFETSPGIPLFYFMENFRTYCDQYAVLGKALCKLDNPVALLDYQHCKQIGHKTLTRVSLLFAS